MKIRNGFVSNSSSSSFVIFGENTTGYEAYEITDDTVKNKIFDHLIDVYTRDQFLFNSEKTLPSAHEVLTNKMFLTPFISDDIEIFVNDMENKVFEYNCGGHGGPYNPDDFQEIADNIWVFKEHVGKTKIEELNIIKKLWIEFSENQKDIPMEYIDIINKNFWEMI